MKKIFFLCAFVCAMFMLSSCGTNKAKDVDAVENDIVVVEEEEAVSEEVVDTLFVATEETAENVSGD